MKTFHTVVIATALFALGACTDAVPMTAPTGLDALYGRQDETRAFRFVHRAPLSPPFKDEVATLEVRPGVADSVTLHFADGTPFARFSVGEETLRGATLNGSPVPAGEAVRVTLRRVDASRYLVDLQPSGIVFNPDAPAMIEFFYDNAIVPRGEVGVFKQEASGEAWSPVEAVNQRDRRVMRGRVDDFTLYAMSAP